MSRPISSVPSQNSADGGLRTARKLVFSGSCGAIHGASSAASTNSSTMPAPMSAMRLRSSLASTRLRGGLLPNGRTAPRLAGTALISSAYSQSMFFRPCPAGAD
jgi:hypothetical protein